MGRTRPYSSQHSAMYNGLLHSTLSTGTACFTVDWLCAWAKVNYCGSCNDFESSFSIMQKKFLVMESS